jgi:glyoxylase-like metal-dependent hydrolase (beta-lactamase superfamily II)
MVLLISKGYQKKEVKMKLYVMQCGVLYSDKGFFVQGTAGTKFDVPVPYFLIEHEKGYVLFDSGHNKATVDDPTSLSDPIYAAYHPADFGDGYVLDALEKAGVKPEEVVYHVCSHLHFDHSGGVGLFPNATYIVQKAELHYAYVPDPFMKLAYLREDFDKDINWLLLDGWNDNRYDLFGDGKLIIYYTPGHTPGHQSLLVNLEESPSMLLAADACYTVENLDEMKLSGLSCDNSAYIRTLEVFKDMQKRGIKIVTGHDPDAWTEMKKYPEFYK